MKVAEAKPLKKIKRNLKNEGKHRTQIKYTAAALKVRNTKGNSEKPRKQNSMTPGLATEGCGAKGNLDMR